MAEKNHKKEDCAKVKKKDENEHLKVDKSSEYLELAQRIKAEFDNYKKRNAESMSESYDNGIAHTVEKLLPAIDSFKQAKSTISNENVLKGLDLVLKQILGAFEELGVTKIEALGKPFDPNFHNAVLTGEDNDKQDDEILEEFQEGFIFKDKKVIRHSVVKINKLNK